MKSKSIIFLSIILLISVIGLSQKERNLDKFLRQTDSSFVDNEIKMAIFDSLIRLARNQQNDLYELRVLVKMLTLQKEMSMYYIALSNCNIVMDKIEKLSSAKNKSVIDSLRLETMFQEGCINIQMSRYEDASKIFFDILKSNAENKPLYDAKANMGIGVVFYETNNIKQAENHYKIAFEKYKTMNYPYGIWQGYNNLAGIYTKKRSYDSAIIYLSNATLIAAKHKMIFEEIITMQNIGSVYQSKDDQQMANIYFDKALKKSLEHKITSTIPLIRFNIAIVKIRNNDIDEAMKILNIALEEAEAVGDKNIKAGILGELSRCYEKKNNLKSAIEYSKRYHELKDSIFNAESEQRIMAFKEDMILFKSNKEKEILEKQLELTEEKLINRNLSLILLTIVVTLIIIIALYYIKKYRAIKEMNLILSSKDDDEENVSDEETNDTEELRNKELASTSLILSQSEETAKELVKKIDFVITQLPINSKHSFYMKEIRSDAQRLIINDSWDEFRLYFEKIHTSFYDNLDSQFPLLTRNEKRLCALIILGLSTKEIAKITNRSSKGVEVARYRLRKRLGLSNEVKLEDFLSAFDVKE